MALRDGHRGIVHPDKLMPLNLWWAYQNTEYRTVFRHHLSMQEQFALPKGAEWRRKLLH